MKRPLTSDLILDFVNSLDNPTTAKSTPPMGLSGVIRDVNAGTRRGA